MKSETKHLLIGMAAGIPLWAVAWYIIVAVNIIMETP